MSFVLQAVELGRWYGQVVGLNELTVEIGPGVTGLLGPNGAGKSTFLKLVAGELRPSRGSVRVLGENPFGNRELFRRVGFCPQQDALYERMNGLGLVTFLGRLSGLDKRTARERAAEALGRVSLTDAMDRRVSTYSKGMRQRVKLAQALVHGPELVILDEPLTGLDPIGRREIIELLQSLAKDGVHVLVSSHVLHEVEALTEEILLLHRGRLLAQGTVGDVRRLLNKHPRRVELVVEDPRRLAGTLIALDEVVSVNVTGGDGRLSVETVDVERFFNLLTELAGAESYGIRRLESVDASLEAVFDYLVA